LKSREEKGAKKDGKEGKGFTDPNENLSVMKPS